MADSRTERVILTSAAQTTSQTSETFVVPAAAKNFLLVVDVTAGSSLSLKITLQMRLKSLSGWSDLVVGIPTSPITGISTTPTCYGAPAADSVINAADVATVGELRAIVVHANANAATYTVTLKPL